MKKLQAELAKLEHKNAQLLQSLEIQKQQNDEGIKTLQASLENVSAQTSLEISRLKTSVKESQGRVNAAQDAESAAKSELKAAQLKVEQADGELKKQTLELGVPTLFYFHFIFHLTIICCFRW